MFWNESDGVSRARKRRDFMVDLSLLGGLIIATADTAGKPSLGWRGRHVAGERGKELAETAGERSAPLIASARKHGESALATTRDRAGALANEAKSEARRLAKH